jgi:hypothetical protein
MTLARLAAACLLVIAAPQAQAQGLIDGRSVLDAGLGIAAATLANGLQHSRDAARAAGTRPMPPGIREGLLPWFPAELLDSIEYRVGAPEEASVPALSIRYGDAIAVAVIDTIIFTNPDDARTNLVLWAHEVQHVAQFRDWGVYAFAREYIRDHQAVERPAQERATEVRRAISGG